MLKLLEDLRFTIGTFFLIVGLMLLFQGTVHPTLVEGFNLNFWTGICFLLFSALALGLALCSNRKS